MPQLDVAIYYHEYSWLFFTFFLFYFIFLKYYLPNLISFIKIKFNNILYYFNLINYIDLKIKKYFNNDIIKIFYKLVLIFSLTNYLPIIYNKLFINNLKNSKIERTIFNFIDKYNI